MNSCTLKFPGEREITFTYPPKSHIPRALAGVGIQSYEPLSQAAFLAAVEAAPGPVFDIGANVGIYSMLVATALGRDVRAYEPLAEAADVLRRIAAEYALPIVVTDAAVSDTVGERSFYLSAKSDMSNSLNADFRAHRGVRVVKCVTVDSEAEALQPAGLKIDTETTELDVLAGAAATMARSRPAVLLEVLDAAQARALRRFFDGFAYQIVEIGDPGFGRAIGRTDDLDIAGDARNWLAIPSAAGADAAFLDRAQHWLAAIKACAITA